MINNYKEALIYAKEFHENASHTVLINATNIKNKTQIPYTDFIGGVIDLLINEVKYDDEKKLLVTALNDLFEFTDCTMGELKHHVAEDVFNLVKEAHLYKYETAKEHIERIINGNNPWLCEIILAVKLHEIRLHRMRFGRYTDDLRYYNQIRDLYLNDKVRLITPILTKLLDEQIEANILFVKENH